MKYVVSRNMIKFTIIGLIAVATICAAQTTESETTKALKEYNLIPDLLTEDVAEKLTVTFEYGVSVELGNIIYPTQAQNQPSIDWDADENAYYTVICTDPDAPKPDDPFLSALNTFMIVNIPGKDIPSGDVLVEYVGSGPPRGADFNRYVYLLYKQPNKIQFDEKPIDKFTIEGRSNFSVNEFASKYQLGKPVAANFYRSKFDDYVMDLYEQLQCCFELNEPE